MTDIVDRLRSLYVEQGTNYVQEAALEIEKLRADQIVLLLALDGAYGLLSKVAEARGPLPKETVIEIRKALPPRFHMSFAAKGKT